MIYYNEILAKKLHPLRICIEAAENHPYGYKFEVDGELDCDQHLLFEKLTWGQTPTTSIIRQGGKIQSPHPGRSCRIRQFS